MQKVLAKNTNTELLPLLWDLTVQFAVEIIQALLSAINYKIPIIIFDAKLSDT